MFLGEAFHAISIESKFDPATYEEAMANVDSTHWVKAIKAELESMNSNQVWDLVEASANIKPIGFKWVYKRKRGFDGRSRPSRQGLLRKDILRGRALTMRKSFYR